MQKRKFVAIVSDKKPLLVEALKRKGFAVFTTAEYRKAAQVLMSSEEPILVLYDYETPALANLYNSKSFPAKATVLYVYEKNGHESMWRTPACAAIIGDLPVPLSAIEQKLLQMHLL